MRHELPFEHSGPWPGAITACFGVLLFGAFVWSAELPAAASAPTPTAPSVIVIEKPVPPPAPAPTPSVVAAPTVSAKVACAPLASVPFAQGLIDAPTEAKAVLAAVVAYANAHPEAVLLVDGHADATGAEEVNVVLSHHRARAVAALLESMGIPKTRLVVRGFGAYQPIEGKEEQAADNRRVTVQVRGVPACPSTPTEKTP